MADGWGIFPSRKVEVSPGDVYCSVIARIDQMKMQIEKAVEIRDDPIKLQAVAVLDKCFKEIELAISKTQVDEKKQFIFK
ncbi:hypothetical protein [Legionella sp.]|uniref:hypothetical protein n=1 Tax=Legionella sp. TaxID=459 RepID=UPI003C8BD12E